MKRIFTLATGLMIAASLFAADFRPQVTISSAKNFKIVVDGRAYFGSDYGITLYDLRPGFHNIQVFEMGRGYFRRERMVANTSFCMERNDLMINIDFWGNVAVRQMKGWDRRFGNDRDRRDDDHDRRGNRGYNEYDRGQQNDGGYDQHDNGRGQQGNTPGRRF